MFMRSLTALVSCFVFLLIAAAPAAQVGVDEEILVDPRASVKERLVPDVVVDVAVYSAYWISQGFQLGDDPVVQSSIDFAWDSGWSLNLWASAPFSDFDPSDDAIEGEEIDVTLTRCWSDGTTCATLGWYNIKDQGSFQEDFLSLQVVRSFSHGLGPLGQNNPSFELHALRGVGPESFSSGVMFKVTPLAQSFELGQKGVTFAHSLRLVFDPGQIADAESGTLGRYRMVLGWPLWADWQARAGFDHYWVIAGADDRPERSLVGIVGVSRSF